MRTGGAQLPSESAHCASGASNGTAPVGGAFTPAAATRTGFWRPLQVCEPRAPPFTLRGARGPQPARDLGGSREEQRGRCPRRPARAFPAASSRGAGGGLGVPHNSRFDAGGRRREGREAGRRRGRERCVRPPARALPPPLGAAATRRGSSDRAPVPPARSSPRPRSPKPAGARCSPCRSRPATGFKVGAAPRSPAPRPPRPARCPGSPGRARRAPARPPARRHLCAPRAAGCGLRAQEVGAGRETPASRRLFVSRRREGVRHAQSPAGAAAGRDQPGECGPPPSLFQPRRPGSLRVARAARRWSPKAPSAPRGPPPAARLCPPSSPPHPPTPARLPSISSLLPGPCASR